MNYIDGIMINDGQFILYKGLLIPDILVKDGKPYAITYLDPQFYIHGFLVFTESMKVENIILLGVHPNQDNNYKYCLNEEKRNKLFTEIYFNALVRSIKTYYVDDAYFIPGWGFLRCSEEALPHLSMSVNT